MLIFLDFEASSLRKASYPIEVGWVREDGVEEAHLIRPAPDWTDWDAEAAVVHGLSRELLLEQGESHEAVVGRMVSALEGHNLFASAPSWDGKWLSVLLRAAGHPRHELRLRDSEIAFREAARLRLAADATDEALEALISAARTAIKTSAPAHRAAADARREWEIWRWILSG